MCARRLVTTVTVGSRLDYDLVDAIDDLAEETGRTRSHIINQALKLGVPVLKAVIEKTKNSADGDQGEKVEKVEVKEAN